MMNIELGTTVVKSDLNSQAVIIIHDFDQSELTQRERFMWSIANIHPACMGMFHSSQYRIRNGKIRIKAVLTQELFDLAFITAYGYKL